MKIISDKSNSALAKQLSKLTKFEYLETKISYFNDSELKLKIAGDLVETDVAIVQTMSKPVNDNLMRLLLLADAAKTAKANKIIAIVPYLCYSRQDRLYGENCSISARLVAKLIESAAIDFLITVDLHSELIKDFYKIPIYNVLPFDNIRMFYKKDNFVIVSPDKGGIHRTSFISYKFKKELAIISKFRNPDNSCTITKIIGDVSGKACLLIDDIIDTGNTILSASEFLLEQGALSVDAFVTHALLSDTVEKAIQDSSIGKVYLTNTVPFKPSNDKFKIINIAKILSKHLCFCERDGKNCL